MKTSKLFFECEKCGQPFDIVINSGDFKKIAKGKNDVHQEYIFEFKREFYCCGKSIEIKINILQHDSKASDKRKIIHETYHRGLRNFRTDDNFKAVIKEVCYN